ncbi:hypothetical protein [Variovorax sp. YR634]|nr:hypothetical protein [Variovorax sp. YR634]
MLAELQSAAAQEKIATKKLEDVNDRLQSDKETLTNFSRLQASLSLTRSP